MGHWKWRTLGSTISAPSPCRCRSATTTYFALPETDRNHWSLGHFGAEAHWLETDAHLPTGEKETADTFFGGDHHNVPLSRFADKRFDEVFCSDLDRDAQGRASVVIKGDTDLDQGDRLAPRSETFALLFTRKF